MKFQWDEEKNQKNRHDHKITLEKASMAFSGPMLIEPENKK
jgi:uncharacterized DUF497 family protein